MSCLMCDILFRSNTRNLMLSLLTCACLATVNEGHLCAQATDQVWESGTPTRCTIVSVSKTSVKISVSGSEREVALKGIRKIAFASEPGELRSAREAVRNGRYENAAETLSKVNTGNIRRALVRQDVQFYLAYAKGKLALQSPNDKTAVSKELLDFVSANPSTFHFLPAAELLGDLAMSERDYALATSYYGALVKEADYEMRGNLLQAKALLGQEEFDRALTNYETVIAQNRSTPEAEEEKLMATVGKALCLAGKGQAKQGVQMLQQIITKQQFEKSPALFAHTYNALGRCYLAMNAPKDALLAFLHVDLLPKLRSADADAHAEALFHLSKLWAQNNQNDRSLKASNLLKARYGGSAWAKQ